MRQVFEAEMQELPQGMPFLQFRASALNDKMRASESSARAGARIEVSGRSSGYS